MNLIPKIISAIDTTYYLIQFFHRDFLYQQSNEASIILMMLFAARHSLTLLVQAMWGPHQVAATLPLGFPISLKLSETL